MKGRLPPLSGGTCMQVFFLMEINTNSDKQRVLKFNQMKNFKELKKTRLNIFDVRT
jgi:hypothetical protein